MFKVSCFYQKVHNFLLCRPTIKCLLQAENSMTDRAYMGEVLTQVWLKFIKKWVSYLTKK